MRKFDFGKALGKMKNMDNQRIAEIFNEISDILEIQGANRFRVLAYRRAAQNIMSLGFEVKDIYENDPKKLQEIPGIGKDLAGKIIELIKTQKLEYHETLIKRFDRPLLELLKVRSIGPKKVQLFNIHLHISSIDQLFEAAKKQKLRKLPGMGEKSEKEILKAIEEYRKHQVRLTLGESLSQAEKIIYYLKKCPEIKKVELAGSLRRKKETIGDLDILIGGKKYEKISKYFLDYPEIKTILAEGETRISVLLRSGLQCDIRIVEEKIFGAALHYFTGSKEHNVAVRDIAKKHGLKINEYGIFKLKKISNNHTQESLIGGKTENEVFEAIGIPYIPPELREDRGELQAAYKNKLPILIEQEDLKGDLHIHSQWSDGGNSLTEIAEAYRKLGFSYIAITDHSPSLAVAHGLTVERFKKQWEEIDILNKKFAKEFKDNLPKFIIFKGVECDIKQDGSLDLPDNILKQMDIVIASVHSNFNLSHQEQTQRVIKALENPYVSILGHPSGRLINKREAYNIDMEKIIDTAIKNKVALEINSQPQRLDLFDYYCKIAKEKGAKFVINSDSHSIKQISFLRFGISVAKRGWLEKPNVLNTLGTDKLVEYLKKKSH